VSGRPLAGPSGFELGRLPRIRFGPGRSTDLPDVVGGLGRRVLLVTGAASLARSPAWGALDRGLSSAGLDVVRESVAGEPSPELVDAIVARHRPADIEVVVGVGGGSVLDTAKAVAGLLRTTTSVMDHLEIVGRGLPYPGPAVPFVAVPTTAGTGSEASRNAVLSRVGSDGFKRSFRDERLVAVEAIVDPDLLAGLPPAGIAANGCDALAQLLEAYVSTRASPITDALARDGLKAAHAGLVSWYAAAAAGQPASATAPARTGMAYAALLSGVCLANAGLGVIHGLAAPLGARFPIPHGVACGATLAAGVEANVRALEARDPGSPALPKLARLGRLLMGAGPETSDADARRALVAGLRSWTERLALPGLGAYGVGEADLATIVAGARGGSMRTNPIELTDAELVGILRASL